MAVSNVHFIFYLLLLLYYFVIFNKTLFLNFAIQSIEIGQCNIKLPTWFHLNANGIHATCVWIHWKVWQITTAPNHETVNKY